MRVVSEEDQYKYSLPPEMAQCTNVDFDTYIKESDLIIAVLIKSPVPENINPVKTMDDFVKDSLKDKRKQKHLNFDNVLEKIEGRNRSVMCPLSKMWTAVESARLSKEDLVEVDLKEIQEFVEETVLPVGQASNPISCCIRFYMLLALTNSPRQSKQMLSEESELLQKNDKSLFGNGYGKYNKAEFPYVVPVEDLNDIHPYIKSLFCASKIQNVQLAGRSQNYIEN